MVANRLADIVRIFCGKVVAHSEALHQRQIRTEIVPDDRRHASSSILEPKGAEHQVAGSQNEAANKESVPNG